MLRSITKRRASLVAVAFFVALLPVAPASAELRTGRSDVAEPASVSASFPGLATLQIQYEDAAGQLTIIAQLRSALVDPATTSALRSTRIDVQLGEIFGDEAFVNSCDWGNAGHSVELELGQGVANLDPNPFTETAEATAPLNVSEDRRTVSVTFPPDPVRAGWNPICLTGDLVGPDGFRNDAPVDFARQSLLDGFSSQDGSIGVAAENDLLLAFTTFVNDHRPKSKELVQAPGARTACTPARGSMFVSCRASVPVPELSGRPEITVRGRRQFELLTRRDPVTDRPGKLLQWRQSLPVKVTWKRCPRGIDATRARARRGCVVSARWRTGKLFGDVVTDAMSQYAGRHGT